MVSGTIQITPTTVEVRDAHFHVDKQGKKLLCLKMLMRGRVVTQTIFGRSAQEFVDELVNGIGFEHLAASTLLKSCIMETN